MNSRIYRNHLDIWLLMKFLQTEEKRVQCISIQWLAGASRKKNPRTISIQSLINNLYSRYNSHRINASQLLKGLANVVTKKNK